MTKYLTAQNFMGVVFQAPDTPQNRQSFELFLSGKPVDIELTTTTMDPNINNEWMISRSFTDADYVPAVATVIKTTTFKNVG